MTVCLKITRFHRFFSNSFFAGALENYREKSKNNRFKVPTRCNFLPGNSKDRSTSYGKKFSGTQKYKKKKKILKKTTHTSL